MNRITVIPTPKPPTLTPEQRKHAALLSVLSASAKDALFALRQLENPPPFTDTDDYSSIRRVLTRAFLVHSALCSRILFPENNSSRDKALAASIRTALGITDTSPLANRQVRNSFEHIDERIEAWAGRATIDRPILDWYTNAFEVEIPQAFANNFFTAYLNGRIQSPGRDGTPEMVEARALADELRRIVANERPGT